MPRFFATGGSESESDSDSEREQIVARPVQAAFTVSLFLVFLMVSFLAETISFLGSKNFPIFQKILKFVKTMKRV